MGAFAEGNSAPLKQSQLLLQRPAETTPVVAMYTPLSQCHAWLGVTQYSAAFQTHIHGVHWVVGRREEGKQGGAGKERGRKGGGEGAREGGRKR